MTIQVGDRFPDATLRRVTREGVRPVSTAEVLAGRRVVVFGVPGAFTPVCSDEHLPGFLLRAEELRRHGVDAIVCVEDGVVKVLNVEPAKGVHASSAEEMLKALSGG